MRVFLIGLGLLILVVVAIPVVMLATGTIDRSSVHMLLNVMTGVSGPAANNQTVRQRYQLPHGFSAQLYAPDLPRARFLHVTPAGDLLVSRPHEGDIIVLRADTNADGKPDSQETLLEGLRRPLGMAVSGSWLYVAESDGIGRALFDVDSGKVIGPLQSVVSGLTDDGNHWSKTIAIGPDNRLYLSQGSTCNVCEEEDSRRATLMRFELDGSNPELVATGLRNSVGFDWAPWNGKLYATENGRDLLGDDFPPCELNQIQDNHFYGWPYFNGNNVADPDMGSDPHSGQRTATAPVHEFSAHNAPLGMRFLDASNLPDEYQRSALVALHGSWNRSSPDGYKVVSLHFSENGIEERDFLSGFNSAGSISGRPVDVAQGPDGAIYISDDYAGAIYRITYGATAGASMEVPVPEAVAPSRLDVQPPEWLATADLTAMADRGGQLYQHHQCASCHEQGTNPKRLEGIAERLGYGAIIETLEAPAPPMPVFPLTEIERRELAVFLLSPLPVDAGVQ